MPAFNQFRWQQTINSDDSYITAEHKAELRERLRSLDAELDRYLAIEYGIDVSDTAAYDAWRTSHQPFHWFVEFYGIMSKGGFDVVIGNPPFVEYRKVVNDYCVMGLATLDCGNLCYFVCERGRQSS